jgi:hypothetical protein
MHRDEIARLPTTLTSLHCIGHLRQSTTLCRSPASLVVDDFVFSARSSAPHVRQISNDVAPFRAPRSDAQPQPLTRAPAAIVHRPRARASRPKALRSGRGCNHSFPLFRCCITRDPGLARGRRLAPQRSESTAGADLNVVDRPATGPFCHGAITRDTL